MSLVATLWCTREAISLLADLSALFEASGKDPDQTVRQTILDFRKVAIGTANRLSADVNALVLELRGLGIDLALTEQNAGNQLRGRLTFLKKMKFNRLENDLHSLEQDIRAFADDVESLLLCAGKNREMSETATSSYAIRTELNGMALKNQPIEIQLNTMSRIVEDLGKQLKR